MWNDAQMGMPYGGYMPQQRMYAQRQSAYGGYGQAQMTAPGNMTWIRAHGVQGAREISVPPGGEAWIMDEDRQVFYFKRADEMGQSQIKAFRFEEIPLDGAPDAARYATREDFDAIAQRIEKLEKFAGELGGVNA